VWWVAADTGAGGGAARGEARGAAQRATHGRLDRRRVAAARARRCPAGGAALRCLHPLAERVVRRGARAGRRGAAAAAAAANTAADRGAADSEAAEPACGGTGMGGSDAPSKSQLRGRGEGAEGGGGRAAQPARALHPGGQSVSQPAARGSAARPLRTVANCVCSPPPHCCCCCCCDAADMLVPRAIIIIVVVTHTGPTVGAKAGPACAGQYHQDGGTRRSGEVCVRAAAAAAATVHTAPSPPVVCLDGLAGTCRACMCPPPVYTAPMAHSGHTRSLRWLSGGGHTCRPGRRVIWMPARTSPGGGASACASARPRSGTSCLPAVGWRRSSPSGCGSRYGYHPRSINRQAGRHPMMMRCSQRQRRDPHHGGPRTHMH
jgi:hypothetical protein